MPECPHCHLTGSAPCPCGQAELDTGDQPAELATGADQEAGPGELAGADQEAGDPAQPAPYDPAAAPRLAGFGNNDKRPGSKGRNNLRRLDWPGMRAAFVEGVPDPENPRARLWPTYAQVAEMFQTTAGTVQNKGAEQGWHDQRKRYQEHLERVRQQKRAEEAAKEGRDLDAGALRVAKTGVLVASARLTQIAEKVQAARAAGNPDPAFDARELNQLAQAADLFHRIGLRAVGDPEGTQRLEVSGPGGKAVNIQAELRRDDPARLTGVLHVLHVAGLGELFGGPTDARELLSASAEAQGGADGRHPTIEAPD